ncbi:phage tail protein [Agromyces soli]
MSEPFLGEIRRVSFAFAPRGWALCNGQLLPINQNQALFSLLGTVYGGDGRTTFALPDLRGRAPVHPGAGIEHGQRAGEEYHTLQAAELPRHTHGARAAASSASALSPQGAHWATTEQASYSTAAAASSMSPGALSSVGGGQPHENRPPYLVVNYIIALSGVFPSRN